MENMSETQLPINITATKTIPTTIAIIKEYSINALPDL
jgi:hypothetical protein